MLELILIFLLFYKNVTWKLASKLTVILGTWLRVVVFRHAGE